MFHPSSRFQVQSNHSWIAFFLLFLAGVACASENQAGFVTVSPSGEILLYFSAKAKLNQYMFFQWPSENGEAKCCIRVNSRNLKKRNLNTQHVLDLRGEGQGEISVYALQRKIPKPPLGTFVGIAASAHRVAAISPTKVMARTGKTAMDLRVCYGAEGVNLISQERHRYRVMYMGFDYQIDQSPRCNSQDQKIIENQTN